jgi:hypothetical protein
VLLRRRRNDQVRLRESVPGQALPAGSLILATARYPVAQKIGQALRAAGIEV